MNTIINDDDLMLARESWGDALISISRTFKDKGIDATRELAIRLIDSTYDYQSGPVMFKPTLATGEYTFRPTREGALSYFIGHDPNYPDDNGFGIKDWRSVFFETSESAVYSNLALWMGWATFTDENGDSTKVEKSWGYKKDKNGLLRIILHHSSLPYDPHREHD